MSLKVQARGKTLYVMGTLLGKRVRMSTGLPLRQKKQAEIIKIQTEDAIVNGKVLPNKHNSFLDFINAYETMLCAYKQGVPKTEQRVINLLKDVCGNCNVGKITTNYLTEHVVNPHWNNIKPNSRSRYITILNAIINHGNQEYEMNVKPYPNRKVDDTRTVHLTEKETEQFLAFVKPSIYYMPFMYLVCLGVRLGELWHVCQTGDRNVWVSNTDNPHSKTKSRTLPIPIALRKAIDEHGAENVTKHFDNPQQASLKLNEFLKVVLTQLNINKDVRVHDLRHTFAYLMAMKGADLAELQHLLGHRDIRMTMKYRGFIPSKAMSVASNLLDT